MRFALLALVACSPRHVDAPAPADVLEEVRLATGGAAWAGLHRMHVSSTLHAGGRDGHQERWEDVEHGRFARESDLPPRHRAMGFDGVSIWTSGDNDVAYALGDEDTKLGAIDTSYQVMRGWWFPERRAASREPLGSTREGTRTFDRVQITPEAGRPFTVWVDRATHLVDRIVEQQGEALSVIRFADYRRVGALLLPFSIREGDGDAANDAIETVTAIELDPAIPDARFALPPVPAATSTAAVTIPFRVERDQILIDVTLDGQTFEADFDTGASLVVPPAVVAKLALSASGATKQSGGGEGFVMGRVGRIGTMALGGAALRDVSFDSFAWYDAHPERLLVGLEILQHYAVRLDFDAQQMTLTPRDAFRYSGDGAVVPFVFQDNQPLVTGTVDGIAGTFAFDTGDDGSLLLMAPFARRHGLVERYHATESYGGSAVGKTEGVRTHVGRVELAGADGRPVAFVDRPATRISTQTSGFDAHRYISGNLGFGVIHQFNPTFDYAHQRIILEPRARTDTRSGGSP
ncbi:MAG TPA: pepsin/retropepsin-like aspartic protease family protein [Kofleriaceae bacterium]|jgi:hypothetical protein